MSIKTMLVHLDDGIDARSHVDTAAAIAHDIGARLIGAYLVPTPEITPTVAALLPKDLVSRRLREMGEAQNAAKLAFHDAALRARVERIDWRAPAGDPRRALIAHGRYTDLVVLAQHDPDDPLADFGAELVTEALFGLGRPLLIVPFIGSPATPGERVLVASDGGREAARAMADAMPLIEQASEVRVLIGSGNASGDASSFTSQSSHLRSWLSDHGVEPVIERADSDSNDKGEWLLSRAADYGSDLVVMGAYGHARVREMVLGGMTRTILRAMTVPVLMSH